VREIMPPRNRSTHWQTPCPQTGRMHRWVDSSCRMARVPMFHWPTRPLMRRHTRYRQAHRSCSGHLAEKYGRPFSSELRRVAVLVFTLFVATGADIAELEQVQIVQEKVRFSGKNRLKRVRLTCRVSTSVAEKSVLKVSAHSVTASAVEHTSDGSRPSSLLSGSKRLWLLPSVTEPVRARAPGPGRTASEFSGDTGLYVRL